MVLRSGGYALWGVVCCCGCVRLCGLIYRHFSWCMGMVCTGVKVPIHIAGFEV
jgi:hypothetical protein